MGACGGDVRGFWPRLMWSKMLFSSFWEAGLAM